MKVSEITVQDIVDYAKLEEGEYKPQNIQTLLDVAKEFISGYTGIPIISQDTTVKTLDNYNDFIIVIYVLCQDMIDNRTLYVDKSNLNKVVESTLGMHCVNLL